MPRRKVRSVERSIASGLTALVFIVVTGTAALVVAHQLRISASIARADFAATSATIAAALQSGANPQRVLDAAPAASAKLYRASGEMIAQSSRPDAPPIALVRWLAPPEVDCRTLDGGVTLCLQPLTGPVNEAAGRGLFTLLIAAVIAIIAGILVGRIVAKPYGEMARLKVSLEELRAQMDEREVMLRRRGVDLEAANREMEAFAWSVSHDLRGPLGGIEGFAQALSEIDDELDPKGREYVGWILDGCRQMRELIEGLLQMSRLARSEMRFDDVDLSAIARSVAESLQHGAPERAARFFITDGLHTTGDERLLRAVLENLMANAWKFTRRRPEAVIEVGRNADHTFFVRDNGVGFDPAYAAKMFRPFQRLHASRDFEGTGIGLATVQKILERHGGKAWAEGEPDRGATIYFTTAAEGAA